MKRKVNATPFDRELTRAGLCSCGKRMFTDGSWFYWQGEWIPVRICFVCDNIPSGRYPKENTNESSKR